MIKKSYNKLMMFSNNYSHLLTLIYGLIKLIMSITVGSIILFISASYSFLLGLAKKISIKSKKNLYLKYYLVSVIILAISVIYILYSIYIINFHINVYYNEIVAIAISAFAFLDITLAIIGIVRAKKRNDLELEATKMTSLVSSYISISITQMALLSFNETGDLSLYNGIGGITFGVLSFITGIYMIIYIFKKKLEKVSKS